MFKSTAHLEAQFASDPSKTLIRLEFYTHLHTLTHTYTHAHSLSIKKLAIKKL